MWTQYPIAWSTTNWIRWTSISCWTTLYCVKQWGVLNNVWPCRKLKDFEWPLKLFSGMQASLKFGAIVVEWSAHRTRIPAVPGSSPAPTTTWVCFSVAPSSNPRPRLQIANWFASGQLGFLKNVMFDLKYLFQLFAQPPLALVCYKH